MRRLVVTFLAIVFFLSSAFAKDRYQRPGPVHLDRDGEKWAEKTLRKMSLEEKVGQLFMIWTRARFYNLQDPDLLQLEQTMQRDHIGSLAMTVPVDGPFLIKTGPYEAAMALNELQQQSKLPLIIAADFERGVSMRLDGTTIFAHAMAFGAAGKLEEAEAFGRITAQEARAIGVQWNFFPDADVNSNPANPIINTRSFGEDPQQVGDLVAAYICGAKSGGMLTTAKHFPGHGDTATDSHLGVAQVSGDMARLQSVELPPFRKAIEAGVDAVMVAHVSAPALEPDPNKVGTTSSAIVTDLLKNQLGFKGLVVTDAIDMAGLTRLYANDIGRAAVDAFKAGNDLLLIPADLDASYKAMLDAVRSGEIPQQRVDASVLKLLKAKASLGLQKARLVDVEAIPKLVAQPANVAVAQQTADDAITLVRDNGRLLPLKPSGTVVSGLPYQALEEVRNRVVAVILSEDLHSDAGRTLARQLRMRVPDANVIYVDPRTATAAQESILKAAGEAQAVIAAVYVIPTAGKVLQGPNGVTNSVSLADASGSLLENLLNRAAEKTVVLAMGNPYVAGDFPSIQNYICSFSNATVSEISAVRALFGEIPIRGHLPVTVPNIAQRGAGFERPATAAATGGSHVQASGH
ncbi:MAG TPA: glycoside hydrolase family 3 protein [Terriglobales bacterium]|nr:glycoside hydrolase family 3 protein [Terriglobales bacterium]